MNSSISLTKANRLFWLGRYVERVYISLNAVKKYIDASIDKNGEAYRDYCKLIRIPDNYLSSKDFKRRYLYDKTNPFSIFSMLTNAFDNAIEVRNDITSESLSYIHLGLDVISKCAINNAKVSELQPVADYMMSFWGSIDENVIEIRKMSILRLGRRLESLDMNIRLKTCWERVNEILKGGVLTNADMLSSVTDATQTERLKTLIESRSGENDGTGNDEILNCINALFKI
ncbi:MAG: alpha-E domain-containing protein [Bacteroidales bacterium]|nr:alpha-E domain-containing protein [Bacteroidales bacterium]